MLNKYLYIFLLISFCANASPRCYSDGEELTLNGIAYSRSIDLADGVKHPVWILHTTSPICVIESNAGRIVDVSNIQIIGESPPATMKVKLKGILSTENVTQYYAETTAIQVKSSGKPDSGITENSIPNTVNCSDLKYDSPKYSESLSKIAETARLPQGYLHKYHEMFISDLCQGSFDDASQLVDQGYLTISDSENITSALRINYKSTERSKNGLIHQRIRENLINLGACTACASNIADEYVKNPNNDLAKLVDKALIGDSNASMKLNSITDYSSYRATRIQEEIDYFKLFIVVGGFFTLLAGLIWWLKTEVNKSKRKDSYKPVGRNKITSITYVFYTFFLFIILLCIGSISENKKPKLPEEQSCVENWKKCKDNDELVNHYSNWYKVKSACRIESENQAKYGTPEFPSFAFSSYKAGNDYVNTGIVLSMEGNAKFQNIYGAMVHSRVLCEYDLNQEKVINIQISEN